MGLEAQRPAVAVEELAPGVVFHSKIAAIKGLPAPACAGLLGDLAYCEAMVLRMLDRMDPWDSFTCRERIDLYYRYLSYWSAMLERFEPQVAFFPIAPHMAYDYVLYALCQRRGIPTLMFEQALINSRLYPMARFEDQQTPVTRQYARLLTQDQGGPLELPPDVAEHLDGLTWDYMAPFYVTRMKQAAPSPWLRVKSLPRQGLSSVWPGC